MKTLLTIVLALANVCLLAQTKNYPLDVLIKDTLIISNAKRNVFDNPVLEVSLKRDKTSRQLSNYPLKVAIDPGHLASSFKEAVLEERFIKTSHGKFYESQLTMATALYLKKLLKEKGFEVMITREEGKSAIGITFTQWYKKRFKSDVKQDLDEGRITQEYYNDLVRSTKQEVFNKYFKNKEFIARANKINAFQPDVTLMIHYNATEFKNTPDTYCPTVDYNYSVAFVPGGFTSQEMSMQTQMEDFFRLASSDDLDKSIKLASNIVNEFAAKLHSPLLDPDKFKDLWYLKKYSTLTGSPGVLGRNLAMTRIVKGPVCYGESLLQNNEEVLKQLVKKDFKIGNITTSSLVKEVADCYYSGTLKYFESIGWLKR